MIYDLIIIGGGPAGITAGIYARRQELNVLLMTKEFGGQMAQKTVEIENYTGFDKISGSELIEKFEDHLRSFKTEVLMDSVTGLEKDKNGFKVETETKDFLSKSVIIATGAEPKKLNIKGEKEYLGKGISYCPLCDGPLFRNKTVAVVGGGDAGFETAIWLSKYAEKIYILEYLEKVPAQKQNQIIAKKINKIEIITNVKIKEIKGDILVQSIEYEDLKKNKNKELKVDGVFVEIGYKPASVFAKKLVDINEKGEIKIDPYTAATKTKGLYAAGDVDGGKCKQIIVSAGEGAIAATSAFKYIQNSN